MHLTAVRVQGVVLLTNWDSKPGSPPVRHHDDITTFHSDDIIGLQQKDSTKVQDNNINR